MPPTLASLAAAARATVAAKAAAPKPTHPKRSEVPTLDPEADDTPMRSEWATVALVLRVERWSCSCGAHGDAPLGLFLLQEHARHLGSTRMQAVPTHRGAGPTDHLPLRTLTDSHPVALCSVCGPGLGFTQPYLPPTAPERRPPPVVGAYVEEWKHLTGDRG
jgi:hypothetical protein